VTASDQYASVRYLVTDVQAAIDFYTTHLGFTLNMSAAPAFADVVGGRLRLLLSGPASSGARATPDDAATAGRNRIHLVVDDLDREIGRLRGAGLLFRSDVVTGPGGRQILLADPDGQLDRAVSGRSRARIGRIGRTLTGLLIATATRNCIRQGCLCHSLHPPSEPGMTLCSSVWHGAATRAGAIRLAVRRPPGQRGASNGRMKGAHGDGSV
jgi:catechol 2,3-dioxygenase-like lactoylglutathione lyase family enzyme